MRCASACPWVPVLLWVGCAFLWARRVSRSRVTACRLPRTSHAWCRAFARATSTASWWCARHAFAAVDATAGMGEDSLLLAAAGFSVTLFERDPVICALLGDALARAAADPALAEAVSRMELRGEDSVPALPALGFSPDVVLLDPMFPERRKSAAVKKKLQLIQRLERPCDDERGLMDAARAAGPRRIVVKRPAKGPWLAGEKPSYTVAGKAIRYDCYAL